MDKLNFPKLDKTVFSLGSLADPPDEKQYWLSKTPYERLEAIEIMRRIIYGYDPLPTDFKDFLKLLKEHEVAYLLFGGYAVGYHGYPRATAVLDIWVAIRP